MKKDLFLKNTPALVLATSLIWISACAPQVINEAPPQVVLIECGLPPPDIFAKTGVDVSFAQSTIGKIVTGDAKVQITPDVISLASQAATDQKIQTYLRCVAIHRDGFTPIQTEYMDAFNALMKLNPSPDQLIQWRKDNPFPQSPTPNTQSNRIDGAGKSWAYTFNAGNIQYQCDFPIRDIERFTDQPHPIIFVTMKVLLTYTALNEGEDFLTYRCEVSNETAFFSIKLGRTFQNPQNQGICRYFSTISYRGQLPVERERGYACQGNFGEWEDHLSPA